MSYTTHWNLPKLPATPVDWVGEFNNLADKLEAGRTVKATALITLNGEKAFTIDSNGKAIVCTDSVSFKGIWQTTIGTGVDGYGQVDGIRINGAWAWTKGAYIYADGSGTLTQAAPAVAGVRPIAWALNATTLVVVSAPNWADMFVSTMKVGKTLVYGSEIDNGNGGANKTIDWTAGNRQKVTLNSATCAFTFTAPPGPCTLLLKVIQDGTGGRLATWPAGGTGVMWAGNAVPVLTTTLNAKDLISFYYDGTCYYASAIKDLRNT